MNEKLRLAYLEWIRQIEQKKLTGIDFFGKKNERAYVEYSNPLFMEVPHDWQNASTRIMFVGQELHGDWGKDCIDYNDIDKLRQRYRSRLYSWVDKLSSMIEEKDKVGKNNSPFWRSMNRFAKNDVAVIWNNCDKICKVKRNAEGKLANTKNVLSKTERAMLHKDTDILKREIEIVEPTHIILAGWYLESLKSLLCDKTALEALDNRWDERKPKNSPHSKSLIFSGEEIGIALRFDHGTIPICFAPHPRYYYSTGKTLDNYEQEIRESIGLN